MMASSQHRVQEYEEYLSRTKRFSLRELLAMKGDFQRPLSRTAVRKIVNEWNIDLWDMPVVGQLQDGTFVLNEGQHRVHAAVTVLGIDTEVECRVVPTDMPGRLFSELNTAKRRVKALDILLADATDENSDAAAILELIRERGFDVSRGVSSRIIGSARMLRDLYRIDSRALSEALIIIDGVMKLRNDEAGWTHGNVIATMHIISRVCTYNRAEMIKRLAQGNAKLAVPYAYTDVARNIDSVLAIYNRGRHDKNRIDALTAFQKHRDLMTQSRFGSTPSTAS